MAKLTNRYQVLIEKIFFDNYKSLGDEKISKERILNMLPLI